MRKTTFLLAPMPLTMVLACAVALFMVNTPAQATFPGSNGKIAFSLCCGGTGRDGEIWTVKPNGSDPTRLTKNSASDQHAAWRPDGKKIAFVSWTDWSNTPIVVMNPDGSDMEQISGSHVSYGLTWSPDGRKMAFEWGCDIYVMNSDGSGDPTRLTTDPNDCAISPDWSPDGTKLAFVSERGTNPNGVGDPGNIYIMKARRESDTNQPWPLTDEFAGDGRPSWSPDGTEIAFDRSGDIYKVNVSSLNETRLTDAPGSEVSPTWSPDGNRIAFTNWFRQDGILHTAIYKMDAAGSNPTPVYDVVGTRVSFPDWQPRP